MAPEPYLSGRLVQPGMPGYDQARLNFNERFSKHPRGIIFCQNAQDVANAVRFARQHRIPLRPRSGRHCYEAYSTIDNGLIIDVSDIDEVSVNTSQRIAHIGAGASLINLYFALWQVGFTLPGGSCPSVGIAGLTLGGGYGLLSRQLGMTCDSLLEVEMIDANGNRIIANDRQHSDLFWALRGGGLGNFGIVTRFTFRIYQIPSVSIYSITWNWQDLYQVLQAYQHWAPSADQRLTPLLKLPARQSGTITSVGQFVGSKEELQRLIEPLRSTGTPTKTSVRSLSTLEAIYHFGGLTDGKLDWQVHWHGDRSRFKNSSAYAYQEFNDAAIRTLIRNLENAPSSSCLVQLDAYGGAINRIPVTATAFPHRDGAKFSLQYQAYWKDDRDAASHIEWVRNFRTSMLPYTKGAYANYIDADIPDWLTAYYGPNHQRLSRIKSTYDPDNVFNYPQSIPPTS